MSISISPHAEILPQKVVEIDFLNIFKVEVD